MSLTQPTDNAKMQESLDNKKLVVTFQNEIDLCCKVMTNVDLLVWRQPGLKLEHDWLQTLDLFAHFEITMIKSHNEGSLPDKEEGVSNARKQTLLRKGGKAVAEKNYGVVEWIKWMKYSERISQLTVDGERRRWRWFR